MRNIFATEVYPIARLGVHFRLAQAYGFTTKGCAWIRTFGSMLKLE